MFAPPTSMKTLTLTFLAALTLSALADTPTDIADDYREKAAAALTKVNATLETATVTLVASLVKAGDTAGAEELTAQLKAKTAGEPVMKPQSSAISLFKLYDGARARALEPAQKAAVARIDAMLASSDGKKLAVVAELGKIRAEIEEGRLAGVPPKLQERWTYHGDPTSTAKIAEALFHPDGTMEMLERGNSTKGTWKANAKGDKINIKINSQEWLMTLTSPILATLDRPDVGRRYLKLAISP